MADEATTTHGSDEGPIDASTEDPVDEGADGQRRCEVLAALCLLVAAAVVLQGIGRAVAASRVGDDLGQLSPWQLVELAAASSSFYPVAPNGPAALGVLVLAYLLVTMIGPGRSVGTVGGRVLQGVVAVGALLTLGGAIATIAFVRQPGQIENSARFGGGFEPEVARDVTLSVFDRGSSVLPVLAGAAVSAYVTWCAVRDLAGWSSSVEADEPASDVDLDPYGADVD